MRIVLFCHSLLSDYDNGSAHFLRGIVTELVAQGHQVTAYEPFDAVSTHGLVRDRGLAALGMSCAPYPAIRSRRYVLATLDLDTALDGADLVLVHEWNDPRLVERIGAHKKSGGRFKLLFHDTHHRAVTAPESMSRFDLSEFDGALVSGTALKDVYERRGWAQRVWVWREAADVRVFRPASLDVRRQGDVVWIGNWADDERSSELREFLLDPVRDLGLVAKIHGVGYPEGALRELSDRGIEFGGWLPNFRVPEALAQYTMTVHVPRRPYIDMLPGIPSIGIFEALACETPLVSAWWDDVEDLFSPGKDFLVAHNRKEMRTHMRTLLADGGARRDLARRGRETIDRSHTCAHRVEELTVIARSLGLRESARMSRGGAASTVRG